MARVALGPAPPLAEALALRDGVIFAKLRGFTHVVMEVDCVEVVDQWIARQESRSLIAPLLFEIEEGLLGFLLLFLFSM